MYKVSFFLMLALFLSVALVLNPLTSKAEGVEKPVIVSEESEVTSPEEVSSGEVIDTTNLNDVSYNYCSKFVWQAFNKSGYTAGYLSNVSIVGTEVHAYVYPSSFSSNMTYVGSYK